MSDIVITADNLSKSYLVGRQCAQRERYTALRDVVAREARNFARKTVDFMRGSQIVQGDEAEEFWALKDVGFEVKRGEVLGIIGRNGAGKSTLLKILSRITEPSEGRVTINGRVASLLEVGTGFHPELTGRENIYLNGAILGMKKAEMERKFDEIVAFAEVDKFIDTPVKRYSSGMTVRLAFSVAAYLDPEILVIDEVLAVGDAEFQRKCLGKMSAVARGGRTVLFVSHNMAAVQNLCTVAMVLMNGQVIYRGESRDAIAFYINKSNQDSQINEQRELIARNRVAWAAPYIVDARTFAADGTPCSTFDLGSDLGIEMTIECPAATTIRQPVMGVVINHALFGPVAAVNMRMTGHDKHIGKFKKFNIRGLIKRMPFVQGKYSVDLWLSDGSRDIDLVNACLSFDIAGTDIYGTGKLPNTKFGVTFLKADWDVSNS